MMCPVMSQAGIDALILEPYLNASDSALTRGIASAKAWAKRHPDSILVEDFLHRADLLRAELQRRKKELKIKDL